jgi:hypothetical protein
MARDKFSVQKNYNAPNGKIVLIFIKTNNQNDKDMLVIEKINRAHGDYIKLEHVLV